MTGSDLAEIIRAAKESAYDQALEDQQENRFVKTTWECNCSKRPRWNGVHGHWCWQRPGRPLKLNPYRKEES